MGKHQIKPTILPHGYVCQNPGTSSPCHHHFPGSPNGYEISPCPQLVDWIGWGVEEKWAAPPTKPPGCGSKTRYPNGTLASGNMNPNPWFAPGENVEPHPEGSRRFPPGKTPPPTHQAVAFQLHLHGDGPHHAGVALVGHRDVGGEGPEVLNPSWIPKKGYGEGEGSPAIPS